MLTPLQEFTLKKCVHVQLSAIGQNKLENISILDTDNNWASILANYTVQLLKNIRR